MIFKMICEDDLGLLEVLFFFLMFGLTKNFEGLLGIVS